MAFVDAIIKRHPELANCDGVRVAVPKTVVLSTDIFDEFMEENYLYSVALSDIPDEEILEHFLKAKLPEHLDNDFLALFDVIENPIAVRSSSLLEENRFYRKNCRIFVRQTIWCRWRWFDVAAKIVDS